MTREEANKELERTFDVLDHTCHMDNRRKEAFNMARVALSAEPCEDAISREEVCDYIAEFVNHEYATDRERELVKNIIDGIQHLPSIQPRTGHCKECKYFKYDSVAKVDGIPLIVAHEICKKWGDGCKTSEDGYCFLFEPQESEDKG